MRTGTGLLIFTLGAALAACNGTGDRSTDTNGAALSAPAPEPAQEAENAAPEPPDEATPPEPPIPPEETPPDVGPSDMRPDPLSPGQEPPEGTPPDSPPPPTAGR